MQFKLINIGRNKVNKTITVKSEDQLIKAVKREGMLMSNDIDLFTEDDGKTYQVIVGGFRPVGTVERVDQ